MFRRYVNHEAGTDVAGYAAINTARTTYYGAELKETNYLPSMRGQIISDIAPTLRDGGSAAAPRYNNSIPEQTLQVSIGSKLIPTLPMRERQQIYHLAMALGLESTAINSS